LESPAAAAASGGSRLQLAGQCLDQRGRLLTLLLQLGVILVYGLGIHASSI
jgi:hypothetical protein